ncbi:uncharacterized protein TNCV_4135511 [Trichonephila clavipes]|nr:uncharacterized protein TNCV_4135511 [Trichonephila clavipes]
MEIIHLSRKSSLLNFSRKRSTIPPLLKICDKPIPEVKSLKILGIIFDPNTTWKNHINYLRQKGFKYLNAIKALSSPKIGTRSDHLLNIINATIRSIFDYGSQLFSFSSNSNRQKLEPIYNAALRLALGLPRNTPLDLLRAESMNGNINSRHNFLCQKFITKQIALKDWSPNAKLFWNIDSNFYKYREKEISIFQKTINLLQELCISKVDILQWIPPPPIYDNRKINIYTHELPFQNKDLPDDIVQNMFNDYIQPKFNNNIIIATDGSKNTNQTSIGILIPKKKIRQNFILKDMISIFTAEAIAIWTALKNWVSETENYIILTDSLSVLKSIQNINRKSNTIILNLSSTLHQCLQIAQSITFIWVPAHKGIEINEEVDKLAKASPEPWNIISWITYEDLHTYFKKQHKIKSEEIWKKSKRHTNFFYISHLEKMEQTGSKK